MAIAIAKAGGLGIIHRNLDIKKQVSEVKKVKKLGLLVGAAVGAGPREAKRAEALLKENLDIKKQVLEVKKVKKQKLLVGAAVGAGPNEFKRAEALLKEKLDMIVVDTAHGHTKKVSEIIRFIKKIKNKKTALCAGNIATPGAAKFLLKLGVDIIKVGIGPGYICTTRLLSLIHI